MPGILAALTAARQKQVKQEFPFLDFQWEKIISMYFLFVIQLIKKFN